MYQIKLIKPLFPILILSVLPIFGFSQNHYLDSLESALSSAKKPIERFEILDKILLNTVGLQAANVDSATCIQMLSIARQLNNDSLLAISYNWIGSYFGSNKGDFTSSLEYYFKALPLAEQAKDKRRISSLYFDISLDYFDLQNFEEALANNIKGGENLPDKTSPMYDFMLIQYQNNMAQYFILTDQVDSALSYAHAMMETNKRLQSIVMEYSAITYLGSAYAKIGKIELAEENFKNANAISDSVQRNQAKLLFYTSYISFLLQEERVQEAKYQAKRLLTLGINANNNSLRLAAVSFLRQVFDTNGQVDSAYYYSRMEADINALIFSQNNKNKIQALAFNEQLRGLEEKSKEAEYQNRIKQYGLLSGLGFILIIAFILFRNYRQQQKANIVLTQTLTTLKSTQSQLIQSEKMASLGELTAGIAHEIQNPLNFVNNFSDVNKELAAELLEELKKGNGQEAEAIIKDIIDNEEKILHHGQRADAIVKGMLQHSRTGGGEKEPTDINALCDEYLRLSYHGLRAKDKSFNADFKTELDPDLPMVKVVPQDIGRVLLNLINNAFYAVAEASAKETAVSLPAGQAGQKAEAGSSPDYKPEVVVSTKRVDSPIGERGGAEGIQISIKDNGPGIPDSIKDKIFQPFFTTKATGQGTGLGLSLSYDIITKGHGGTIEVRTSEEEGLPAGQAGTEFLVILPS